MNLYPESECYDVTCPTCHHVSDHDTVFIGRLGWLAHYRCRFCGTTFHEEA